MTLHEFKQDIQARIWSYASIGEADRALPAKAIVYISNVVVAEEFPAAILFTGERNMMKLTQIQEIERKDGYYAILCGENDELRTCVNVHFRI